jgi:UDP-N-acetylglucosamine 1-carboxyvinyltransferase
LGPRSAPIAEYRLSAPSGLRGADIYLDEASVTGTENAVMAAVLARGATIIRNAACEPHVQDLCNLLCSMGATIEGIGSNVLTVHGVESLHGASHRVGADHIEVASFIGLAAVTGGEVLIEDAAVEHRWPIRHTSSAGVEVEIEGDAVRVPAQQSPIDTCTPRSPRSRTGGRCSGRLDSIAVAVARRPPHGPVREDAREPPVLHRQAGL